MSPHNPQLNKRKTGRSAGQWLRQLPITEFAHNARIVGDQRVRAILAACNMAAESGGATALDGRHDLQLLEAHMTGIGFAPRRSVLAEDIRDLQRWARHSSRVSGGRLAPPPNLGLLPGSGLLR